MPRRRRTITGARTPSQQRANLQRIHDQQHQETKEERESRLAAHATYMTHYHLSQNADNDTSGQVPQQNVQPNSSTGHAAAHMVQFLARRFPLQVDPFSIGTLTTKCSFCNALLFQKENHNCCHKGKVKLPPLAPYPTELKDLFTTDTPQAQNFRANIRSYNSSMAFTSFGANIVSPPGHGPYAFRLHGQVYHRSGSLHPPQGTTPCYSQLYILETSQALQARMQQPANQQCLPDVTSLLQNVLQRTNPYAAAYKQMQQVEAEQRRIADQNGTPQPVVTMHILRGGDQRRYNDPRQDEIAVVFSSPDGAPPHKRYCCAS